MTTSKRVPVLRIDGRILQQMVRGVTEATGANDFFIKYNDGLRKVMIGATDGETSGSAYLIDSGEDNASLEPICLPAQPVIGFLASDHNEVTIYRNKKSITMSGSLGKINLRPIHTMTDILTFPTRRPDLRFSRKEFLPVFTLSRIANNGHVPMFQSVNLALLGPHTISAVATNGIAAGYCKIETRNDIETVINIVIPAAALLGMKRNTWKDEIEIYADSNRVYIVSGNYYAYSVLSNIEYPLEEIIRWFDAELAVAVSSDTHKVKDALSGCAALSEERSKRTKPIKVEINHDGNEGSDLLIETTSEMGEASFSIPATIRVPGKLDAAVDSRMVANILSILGEMADDMSILQLGIDEENGWIMLSTPGDSNRRFALAGIVRQGTA